MATAEISETAAEASGLRWLQLWLRVMAVVFAVTGLAFLAVPGLVVQFLNSQGGLLGLPSLDVGGHRTLLHFTQFWIVLAVAYMALVTLFAWDGSGGDRVREAPVRYLVVGKTASSLGSLLFFAVGTHGYGFLANFIVDGLIAIVTVTLWRRAVQTA